MPQEAVVDVAARFLGRFGSRKLHRIVPETPLTKRRGHRATTSPLVRLLRSRATYSSAAQGGHEVRRATGSRLSGCTALGRTVGGFRRCRGIALLS